MVKKRSKKGINLVVLIITIVILFFAFFYINIVYYSDNKTSNNDVNEASFNSEIDAFLKIANLAYNEIYCEKVAEANGEAFDISLGEVYAKLVDINGNYKKEIIKKEINEISTIKPTLSEVNVVYGIDGRDSAVVSIESEDTLFAYYVEINGGYYQMKLNDASISLSERLNSIPGTEISEVIAVSSDESIVTTFVNNNVVTIKPSSNKNGSATVFLTYKSLETSLTVNVKSSCLVEFNIDNDQYILPQMVAYGEKATQPSDPIKDNCIFGGWYSDAELTTLYDFDLEVDKNITIYAKFE